MVNLMANDPLISNLMVYG